MNNIFDDSEERVKKAEEDYVNLKKGITEPRGEEKKQYTPIKREPPERYIRIGKAWWTKELSGCDPRERVVLCTYVCYMNSNRESRVSFKGISRVTGIHPDTVKLKYLSLLEKGLIKDIGKVGSTYKVKII